MRNAVSEIRKHLLIYILFAKNSLISQMEYRATDNRSLYRLFHAKLL